MPEIDISDDESVCVVIFSQFIKKICCVFLNYYKLLCIQNLTINKKAKINTKQDGVVDNKKDVDGNSSDYEDLLPYSNKDTREQHFQNEENMVCIHIIIYV